MKYEISYVKYPILYGIYSILTFLHHVSFFLNHTSSFRLLFLRDIVPSPNLSFFLVFGRTLIPECAYRPWDHLRILVKKIKNGKPQVESWIVGFSLLLFLCLFEEFIEGNIFPLGWGTTSRSLRCQNVWGTTSRSLRCLKVHVRYCVRYCKLSRYAYLVFYID